MSQEFDTLELAKIYESQGYFKDAFEIYQALAENCDDNGKNIIDPQINDGLNRMSVAMGNPPIQLGKEELEKTALETPASLPPEKRIEKLLEQWLMLMVSQKRLSLMKQVKSRI
jgi:hypothetical protein